MIRELFDLTGKTAIITGSGSGLGRAMAIAMAESGCDIVGVGRRRDALEETQKMVEAKGRRYLVLPGDVTNSAQVNQVIADAIAQMGRIDILINNAGGGARGGATLLDMTDEDWHRGIDLNLTSVFFCSRAIMPHFLERGGGRIINVTSAAGYRARRNEYTYGTSKGGLIQLTKALGMSYARDNVRVTCIAPGQFPTRFNDPARIEQVASMQPMNTVGTLHEMGAMAVFLASGAADYMTGETILSDGGTVAGGLIPAGIAPRAEG